MDDDDCGGRRQKIMVTSVASLPLDLLLHKLVCFIPFPEVLKLRCVCKTWHEMLPQLLKMNHGRLESDPRPWLVMASYPVSQPRGGLICFDLVAYVLSLKRWLPFNLGPAYKTPVVGIDSAYQVECHSRFVGKIVMASSGGLVCTMLADGNLFLFNPLTGKTRTVNVPKPIDPQDDMHESIFIVQAPPPGSFYVVVVRNERADESHVQIYDVKARIWKQEMCCEGHLSGSGVLGFVPFDSMKYSADQDIKDSDIFCYRFSGRYNEPEAWKLAGYCISKSSWCIVDVATPDILDDMEPSSDLVVWKEHSSGRIFLAAILRPDLPATLEEDTGYSYVIAPIPAGFGVWDLQQDPEQGYIWHPIATSPTNFLSNFHRDPDLTEEGYIYSHVSFFTSGNIVLMAAFRFIEFPDRVKFAPPILYDVAKNEWMELPAANGECHRELAKFAYTPSFDDSFP